MSTHQVSLDDEIGGIKMMVICKECKSEMEYKEKYGSKNEGIYNCPDCGNFVYKDTMEKKAGKTIILVPDEELLKKVPSKPED
jgi:hypothetical protein